MEGQKQTIVHEIVNSIKTILKNTTFKKVTHPLVIIYTTIVTAHKKGFEAKRKNEEKKERIEKLQKVENLLSEQNHDLKLFSNERLNLIHEFQTKELEDLKFQRLIKKLNKKNTFIFVNSITNLERYLILIDSYKLIQTNLGPKYFQRLFSDTTLSGERRRLMAREKKAYKARLDRFLEVFFELPASNYVRETFLRPAARSPKEKRKYLASVDPRTQKSRSRPIDVRKIYGTRKIGRNKPKIKIKELPIQFSYEDLITKGINNIYHMHTKQQHDVFSLYFSQLQQYGVKSEFPELKSLCLVFNDKRDAKELFESTIEKNLELSEYHLGKRLIGKQLLLNAIEKSEIVRYPLGSFIQFYTLEPNLEFLDNLEFLFVPKLRIFSKIKNSNLEKEQSFSKFQRKLKQSRTLVKIKKEGVKNIKRD